MAVLKNRAKMSTSTTGTGTITLGSAEDGYQTFADAGVANADVVRYVIEDGSNFEIGTGTYTSSGTTLSRTVSESSNSDAAINLSGSATVFIGATAEDIPALYADNASGATAPVASGTNAVALGSGGRASGTDTLAFNNNFSSYGASATGAIALGYKTRAQGSYSLAIGKNANSSGNGCISLGENSGATFNHSVAIGYGSYSLNNTHAVAIGYNSFSTGGGSYSLALMNSNSNGANSLAAQITNNTTSYGAQGANSIAIGQLAKATQANSIAIGDTATSTTANQIALGGTTDTVKISGTYTLPTTDGTNGQVLTTDGSGAVTFADAGGGDPDLYRDNASSATTPVASGANAFAIGTNTTASNTSTIAIGADAVASGYQAQAIGNQTDATATNSSAFGNNSQATASNATAIGGATASASYSTSIGKTSGNNGAVATTGNAAMALNGYASGAASFAAAIDNNTSSYGATGANSVSIGNSTKADGANAVAIGSSFTRASGSLSLALSRDSHASGTRSVAIGGGEAEGESSFALGLNAKTEVYGKFAYASSRFSAVGDAQGGQFILRADTTDATATVLTTNNGSASTDNQIIAASDTCITFDGTITAMQNGAQAYASWKIEGLLVNDGGTTTLANSATTVIQNSSGWGMALSADNTNNALAITCTGEAAHNIRWVANIRTTEVTYA